MKRVAGVGVGLLHIPKRRPTLRRVLAVAAVLGGAVLVGVPNLSGVPSAAQPVGLRAAQGLAAVMAGTIFPVQAAVNRAMQEHVGTPFRAVTISMGGGTIALSVLGLCEAAVVGWPQLGRGEAWMFLGGSLGCVIVTCTVVGVPALGAAAFLALMIAAQLATALAYDLAGAFAFAPVPVTAPRAAGVALAIVAAGVYLRQAPPPAAPKAAAEDQSEDAGDKAGAEPPCARWHYSL